MSSKIQDEEIVKKVVDEMTKEMTKKIDGIQKDLLSFDLKLNEILKKKLGKESVLEAGDGSKEKLEETTKVYIILSY